MLTSKPIPPPPLTRHGPPQNCNEITPHVTCHAGGVYIAAKENNGILSRKSVAIQRQFRSQQVCYTGELFISLVDFVSVVTQCNIDTRLCDSVGFVSAILNAQSENTNSFCSQCYIPYVVKYKENIQVKEQVGQFPILEVKFTDIDVVCSILVHKQLLLSISNVSQTTCYQSKSDE